MRESVLIICPKILKHLEIICLSQLIIFIIKFAWLMATKIKPKQTSNNEEGPVAYLFLAQVREMSPNKRTNDRKCHRLHITVLTELFGFI